MEWLDWHNCYDGGWKSLIVDEAFRHPAKFAYGLVTRIYRHGLDQGYWRPGDLIGDPFGGVGLGGIVAAYHNLRWIGVELESESNGGSPFVELARQNFAFHEPRWKAGDDPVPVIVQGDSRRFAEIVREASGVVTSPPYADSIGRDNGIDWSKAKGKYDGLKPSIGRDAVGGSYGVTPGQIGGLREGSLDAVVTSPPFRDARSDTEKSKPTQHGGPAAERHHTTQAGAGYGGSPGQIDNMRTGTLDGVITSPPYAESIKGDNAERETAAETMAKRRTQGGSLGQSQRHGGYGASEGNIGNLREGVLDGAVTSPPFMDQNACNDPSYSTGRKNGGGPLHGEYGKSAGQIGNDAGETYWQAMHAVYGQMFLAMKPGACAAVVLKDYVKNKARVPLCDQSCTLLESIGFDVFQRCRCWLVKRTETPGLFGEPIVETTERKSFFRRLAEAKGSPRIDYEEVLWARKR